MKENPLITVIVPVYRIEKYLDQCMKSLCSQTYEHLEIILVDDGSNDGCPAMCDAYADRDSRILVIHKKNGGLSDARNVALDVAKGEYIAFLDGDDYVAPDWIACLYNAIQQHNCEIAVCGHYVVNGEKCTHGTPPVEQTRVYPKKEALLLLLEDEVLRNYVWDKLYKRELFAQVRFPVGRSYEDSAVMYLLFDRAQTICQVPEYLYYYIKRSGSLSANETKREWLVNCRNILKNTRERYEYFAGKQETDLQAKSLVSLQKYSITYLNLSYVLHDRTDRKDTIKFLKKHRDEIRRNPEIIKKEKRLVDIYTAAAPIAFGYAWVSDFWREHKKFRKGK